MVVKRRCCNIAKISTGLMGNADIMNIPTPLICKTDSQSIV